MRAIAKLTIQVTAVAVLVCALIATPASANKKKKKRPTSATLAVVVLPFVGKGTGGADAKDALELELDLVESVKVTASAAVEGDLRGKRSLDATTLAAIMAKRDVDVLIRGERGPGARAPDALLVTAYGKDGQPRYAKELALGSEPDVNAPAIVSDLKPMLAGWKTLRPLKITSADDDDGPKVRASDVIADDEPKTKVVKKERSGPVKSVLDDDDAPAPPHEKKAAVVEKKGSPLDFNDPADDSVHKKKRARDDDGEKLVARADIDENGRKRAVMDDLSDSANKPPDVPRLGHTFALTGAFDGATWYYGFDGGGVGDTQVAAAFYPGGSASVDFWPLTWLGADGEVALAAVPFRISGGQVAVRPTEFTSLQTRLAATLKARYTLKNGIGLGVRAGYRYFGASVDEQTIDVGGQTRNLTVVPGYSLHAGVVGAEVFLPILIGGHRLELELRADGLPRTYYDEKPDNPGQTTLAFGWSGQLAARYDVASGFFVELRGQSTGATVTYSQQGSRLALVGNQLTQLQGGSVLNLMAGFSAGVGFEF